MPGSSPLDLAALFDAAAAARAPRVPVTAVPAPAPEAAPAVEARQGGDPFVALFSESTARAIVTVTPDREDAFTALAEQHGVPVTALGHTGGGAIVVEGQFELPVAEAKEAWSATLPAALGS